MRAFYDKIKSYLIKIKSYIIEYKLTKYICGLAVFVCMCLILGFFTGEEAIARREKKAASHKVSGEKYQPEKEFEVDAYHDVNQLVYNYFSQNLLGNYWELGKIAYPMSSTEKSYHAVMGQFYESYENIHVYTKHGLSGDSYIAAITFDIRFYDCDTLAPSMMLFYIETNEEGKLYINNLYSDYNLHYNEAPLNKDVYTALRKFTTTSDYLALYNEIEVKFANALKNDAELYQLIKRVIPMARQEWEELVYYYNGSQGTEESEESEETEITENTENSQNTESTESTENEGTGNQEGIAYVRVIQDDVRIRASASAVADENIMDYVNAGAEFEKLGTVEDWVKIKYYDGSVAFIKAEFVEEFTK